VSLHRDIRECQRYADACGRIAARAADAKTQDDFLRLQRSWLRLGRSLAFAARLSDVCKISPTQFCLEVGDHRTVDCGDLHPVAAAAAWMRTDFSLAEIA
jgi:hypothetical protein